jgi:hypothetical protein
MKRITVKKMFFGLAGGYPSGQVPDDWPRQLKELQSLATLALKSVCGTNSRRFSGHEPASEDDVVTMMRALADPKKTAAAFFAMGQAMSEHDGWPLSEELVQVREISEGLGQERLTDGERQAIERVARQRK